MRPSPPAITAALLLAGQAQAHVVLEPAAAPPGQTVELRFVVGHGCKGQPTTALRVTLPPQVKLVEVEPKPGWAAKAEPGAVSWRGELPAAEHGEFAIRARLPRAEQRLTFPAAQSCGDTIVRWDQAPDPGGVRPAHPVPTLDVTSRLAPAASVAGDALPPGVQRRDGHLADASGRPLYTFDHDTMVGMSHCVGVCAQAWPPLPAPADAKALGDWKPIWRDDGSVQWTWRDKPLYTYAKDAPGGRPTGEAQPGWRLAR